MLCYHPAKKRQTFRAHDNVRARHFAPNLATWLTEDRIRVPGKSPFVYVGQRPILFVDPSGLREEEPFKDWWERQTTKCDITIVNMGCIGVTKYRMQTTVVMLGATCFNFPKASDALKSATAYAKTLKCKYGVGIFAVNYWANPAKPAFTTRCPHCGLVTGQVPSGTDPSKPPAPLYDYCFQEPDGTWTGADHGQVWNQGGGFTIYHWKDIDEFQKWYNNYNTVLVCVACKGPPWPRTKPTIDFDVIFL